MDRSRTPGYRPYVVLLTGILLVGSTGCLGRLLATVAYVVTGTNVEAAYDGLKEKRVVVICSAPGSLGHRYANADREVANRVRFLLAENVKKIDVVTTREIEKWTDEQDWENFREMATALKADMVLHIDMEHFSLEKGTTLYQGQSTVSLTVYDMKKGGREAWQKTLDEVLFPANSAVPAQEKPLAQFRRQYVSVLAEQIARHFYPHDAHFDFAADGVAHN